ncbi:MAG: SDR family oxidoreductase [Chloroflexaceae bacterium]
MEPQRVALVTGSRKGLGKFIAQQLLDRGYRVVGCSREPADWEREGYWHLCADVGDEQQVQRLMSQIRQRFGRLDITINNAGIASMNHALLIPAATVNQVMEINVRGTFLVSRESARLMRKHQYGRIVNLTTVAVPLSLEGESIYVASKSAVEALTRVMSRELAPFGITVNAVGPTPVETDLIRNVPRDKIEEIVNRLAIKRLGEPADVFNVIEFFIRPESDYITGQIIYLGGA